MRAKMSKIIYPYIRFSKDSQAKGDSLRRQTERINEYADKHGYTVDNHLKLEDLGKSAYEGKHLVGDGAMGRFLLAIEQGYISTDGNSSIAVEQLDRLSRQSIEIASDLFKSILRKNVNIITLMDNKIYTKASLNSIIDILHSLLLMEQAFKESHKKGERVAQAFVGKIERIKNGEKVKYSAMVPAWLDVKKDYKNIPKNSEKTIFNLNGKEKVAQQIFAEYDNESSMGDIAKKLNGQNIEKFGRKRQQSHSDSGIWTSGNISHLLAQKAVLGDLIVKTWVKQEVDGIDIRENTGTETIKNYYPQIITHELWDRVQAKKTNSTYVMERGRKTTRNLFTSLLYCADCSKRIHFETDEKKLKSGIKKYSTLKCYSRRYKNKDGCISQTIRYQNFEKNLFDSLLFRKGEPSPATKNGLKRLNEKSKDIEDEILKINKKLNDLNNEFQKSAIYDTSIFMKVSSQLKRQIDTNKRDKELIDRQIITFDRKIDSKYYDLTKEKDRELTKRQIKSLVAGIIISTTDEQGFIIYKDGNSHTFRYGYGNHVKGLRKALGFIKKVEKDNKNGQADLKLLNIIQALELWELSK